MERISERLYSWASEIDEATLDQALKTARLPIVDGHVALMPDAHLGIGATIGSVIPTKGAVIPSAVGVDIGCGMIAAQTSLRGEDLPDDLIPFVSILERAVPAGLGHWHEVGGRDAQAWFAEHRPASKLTPKQEKKAVVQLGTLGSGNHFFEVCLDERDVVWLIMHSGSRGLGNELATAHMKVAKRLHQAAGTPLEDPELAYLQEGTPEFDRYVADMLWAQDYAAVNRRLMMDAAMKEFLAWVGHGSEVDRINCHHNFTQKERHDGHEVWVTRKGAIRADTGDRGLIPGSMGAKSYVVRGLGNPLAYRSCAHGAGRRMSRRTARKTITLEEFGKAMGSRAWQRDLALKLLDEAPGAYKDIDRVMEDQRDLVEVIHTLEGIVNYKGTS